MGDGCESLGWWVVVDKRVGLCLFEVMRRLATWILGMAALVATAEMGDTAEWEVVIGTGSEAGIFRTAIDRDPLGFKKAENILALASPGFLAAAPDGGGYFAVSRRRGGEGAVVSLKAAEGGRLEVINEVSSMGNGPCHVSVDSTGRCVFVANYSSGHVASYRVGEGGELSTAVSVFQHEGSSVHPRQRSAHPHLIRVSPDNKHVYVPDLGTDEVVIYQLNDETAELSRAGAFALSAGAGPRHLDFSKDGELVFVVGELDLAVHVLKRDAASGELSLQQKLAVGNPELAEVEAGILTASEIQCSSDGRFVYTTIRDTKFGDKVAEGEVRPDCRAELVVMEVNEGGEGLEVLQRASLSFGMPRHFKLSPDGKWLVIAGQRSERVYLYAVSPQSGRVADLEVSVEVPTPMWIGYEEAAR